MGDHSRRRQRIVVESWSGQLANLLDVDPADRFAGINQALRDEISAAIAHRSRRCPFCGPDLQQVELAGFDREFDVDRVAIERFEDLAASRSAPSKAAVQSVRIGKVDRRMCPRDEVLALAAAEIFAVERLVSVVGVARKRDAGAGIRIRVAEHHRLHRDGCAEVV